MTRSDRDAAAQADADALEAQIAAEDPEDRRLRSGRRRKGLSEPKREINAFEGFASGGVAAREEEGKQ